MGRHAGALRVLHTIDSLQVGGAERLLVTLARFTDRRRYDLRVCSLRALDERSPVVAGLRRLEVPLYSAGGPLWHNPVHVLQVARLCLRERIDVVHGHLPYATTVGILASRLAARPAVATLHSTTDAHRVSGGPKYAFNTATLRWGADAVIAVSPEVGAYAVGRRRVQLRKLRVIPNAIDLAQFTDLDAAQVRTCRCELLGASPGPLVVSVGRLHPSKGHEYLVDATPRLLQAYPNARVAIIGPSGANESNVRARISALGLGDRVILAGSRDDIPHVLAAADVVALSSVWEGLPLAVLEGMAAQKPIVATAVGGVPSTLRDGVDACLVPPCDPLALADAIIELLARPELACRLAASARARVHACHGVEAWAGQIHAVYRELAA